MTLSRSGSADSGVLGCSRGRFGSAHDERPGWHIDFPVFARLPRCTASSVNLKTGVRIENLLHRFSVCQLLQYAFYSNTGTCNNGFTHHYCWVRLNNWLIHMPLRKTIIRWSFFQTVCRYVAFVTLLLFPGAALAQSAPSCKVLDAELQGAYTGECRDGLAEGQGEARGKAYYKGEFKAGRKHGKGVKSWPSGDRYEGDFVDDRKEGKGAYTWGSRSPFPGERYSGEWLNDKRHGNGVYEWPGGDRYAGPWKNDGIAGPPTKGMIARARADAERISAVSRPGVKVCREMRIGIATRDMVRGTVLAREGEKIRVRVEDPGKFEHAIGDRQIAKGDVVLDPLKSWVPCI